MIRAVRTIVVTAAALLGAVAFACADPIDDKACDGSTYEMVDCINAKTEAWDKRLNAAYQTALKDAEPQQRELLRSAQRAWIKFRDANCAYIGAEQGTIARVDAAECLRGMTEARARELEGPK